MAVTENDYGKISDEKEWKDGYVKSKMVDTFGDIYMIRGVCLSYWRSN